MMKEMLTILKKKGYKQVSLAVQKANYAVKMYRNIGFEIVDENAEAFMLNFCLTEGDMGKSLSDMTLEELWRLFPIVLTEHKEIWHEWYVEEQRRLCGLLPSDRIKINHIGSTAINNIWAKPIIDILVELPRSFSMESVKEMLIQNGYICMLEQPNRKSFNRGYTNEGFAEKVFHLHLRYDGDNDELYFRDYMNDNPLVAKQYEKLKLSLWKQYEHDRDGYTNAKADFVAEHTNKAKKEYGNKY